ncbi:hypothetical protein BREVNS_0998 [Brevinematales bacterium NS]|nr:hypothetical protein BREVNS_0998 [Brevinematales bacterium NS]
MEKTHGRKFFSGSCLLNKKNPCFETLARVCFLSLSGSGATPLKPRFFCLQGLICLFYSKK